jgi:hypothetical protein
MADFTRVDIGFQGGQTLSVRVEGDEYSGLHKAVAKGDGWYELKTQDSDVFLNLGEVVYVRLDTEEHRVGF